MPSKELTSKRKRSRPVIKRRKTNVLRKNKFAIFIIFIFIIGTIGGAVIVSFNIPEENQTTDNENSISNQENPVAIFNTSMGSFNVELYKDKVPKTCDNFIKLVNDEFYNGMIFYRISDDFMIQAGRYLADGSEKQSPYGRIEFETHEDVKHVDGAISMASTGAGIGGSSEFFICDGAQEFLDGNYAPFGVVIQGIEVVREIAAQPHDNSNPAGGGKPLVDIIINSITIEE